MKVEILKPILLLYNGPFLLKWKGFLSREINIPEIGLAEDIAPVSQCRIEVLVFVFVCFLFLFLFCFFFCFFFWFIASLFVCFSGFSLLFYSEDRFVTYSSLLCIYTWSSHVFSVLSSNNSANLSQTPIYIVRKHQSTLYESRVRLVLCSNLVGANDHILRTFHSDNLIWFNHHSKSFPVFLVCKFESIYYFQQCKLWFEVSRLVCW